MSKAKFGTPEEKQALVARALALKPRVATVVATALGWAQPQSKGTLELLVSFKGLDELLGDLSADQTQEEPLTLVVEPVFIPQLSVVEEEKPPVVVEPEAVVEVAPVVESPVVEEKPKAKGGRPPKVKVEE